MTLGPITIIDSEILKRVLAEAKHITDLGVVPVRVWRLVGECLQHGRIEDEATVLVTEQPPSMVKCELCVVARNVPMTKNATAALLRG